MSQMTLFINFNVIQRFYSYLATMSNPTNYAQFIHNDPNIHLQIIALAIVEPKYKISQQLNDSIMPQTLANVYGLIILYKR
jgi:hypothetical protein